MAIITGYSRGTWNQSAWNEAIPVDITGEELNIFNGNTNIIANGTINIIGSQANISVSTLKFWDPIRPTITETWTNIH